MARTGEEILIWKLRYLRDRQAADELIRNYYKEIYGYVYRQVGEKEQAMDLTQEIFLGMLSGIGTYDKKKAGFRTWLYRIATHKIVDYYRSRAYQKRDAMVSIELLQLEGEGDLEIQATDQEMAAQIFHYLGSQDSILEEIFRLKFYGEYTFEEIGEILAIPVSTVKTKYYGAQKAIRKEFR